MPGNEQLQISPPPTKGLSHVKKTAVLLDFVQIASPLFGQLVQLFLSTKNVDLSYNQYVSLSKINLN